VVLEAEFEPVNYCSARWWLKEGNCHCQRTIKSRKQGAPVDLQKPIYTQLLSSSHDSLGLVFRKSTTNTMVSTERSDSTEGLFLSNPAKLVPSAMMGSRWLWLGKNMAFWLWLDLKGLQYSMQNKSKQSLLGIHTVLNLQSAKWK
jgi:hypothetical protein